MTGSGSFPDRVRVADADDRYFRSCACDQRQEDPHFCARAARRTCAVAGAACMVFGARFAGSGLHGQLGARRAGGGSAPKTWLNRCLRVLFRSCASQRVTGQVSAGDASGPRPLTAGLNDRHARAKPLGALPLFQVAVAPGGHAARASARRCPPLDARATAPSGVLCSSQKLTPCCPLPELPGAARRRSGARPKAAPRPQWRSSTSGAGSRRTYTC